MITGLNHANISTTRLKETAAFFTDVLGLRAGPRPGFVGFDGAWLYVGDQAVLHLVERDEAHTPDGAIDHISFTVEDFDAAIGRLDAKGVHYVAMDIPDGFGRQAFLKDPNGITIELTWRPA